MQKSLLLFLIIMLSVIVSCKKSVEKSYYQKYIVVYYEYADSFVARAAFVSDDINQLLASNESIVFNSKRPDFYDYQIYWWIGKGLPEMNFIFNRKNKLITNSISSSRLGKYSIVTPDTVYKSKGFTVKLNRQNSEVTSETLQLSFGGALSSLTIKGDTAYIDASSLKTIPAGIVKVTLRRSIRAELPNKDDNQGGDYIYEVCSESKQFVLSE